MGDAAFLAPIGAAPAGREVAQRFMAFGDTVVGYDRFMDAHAASKVGMECVELSRLYACVDFISSLRDERAHGQDDQR